MRKPRHRRHAFSTTPPPSAVPKVSDSEHFFFVFWICFPQTCDSTPSPRFSSIHTKEMHFREAGAGSIWSAGCGVGRYGAAPPPPASWFRSLLRSSPAPDTSSHHPDLLTVPRQRSPGPEENGGPAKGSGGRGAAAPPGRASCGQRHSMEVWLTFLTTAHCCVPGVSLFSGTPFPRP